MNRAPRLNRHMSEFLRSLRSDPQGLPVENWPRATTLRRWLRRPRFRQAMASMMETARLQTDWMTAATAARASRIVQSMLTVEESQDINLRDVAFHAGQIEILAKLVRMDHLRQKEVSRRTGKAA